MSVARPPGDFLSRQQRVQRRHGPSRWRSGDGKRLYEWDALHGHVEVYDARGYHLGVADAMTGELIGKAVRGRRIDV